MFVITALACLVLTLGTAPPSAPERLLVTAEPDSVTSGEAITLHCRAAGKKIVLSGGRFGKGVVVTGRDTFTDHPKHTTRYTFEVWPQAGVKPTSGKESVPQHARYSVVVEVRAGSAASLTTYRSTNGWRIDYLREWKRDHVMTPDEGKDGLVYFQKEEDSVERIAVAVMAAGEMTTSDLVEKVCSDMPSRYANLEVSEKNPIQFQNADAVWLTFSGNAFSHPDKKVQSMALVFVRDGRGFVVSARTSAVTFKARQAVLERMIKSFTLIPRWSASAHEKITAR